MKFSEVKLPSNRKFGLFFIAIFLFMFSWEYKNFASLLSVGVIFSALIASIIPKSQIIVIPLTAVLFILVVAEIILPSLSPSSSGLTQHDRTSGYASGGYNERIEGFGYRPNPGVYTSRKITSEGEVIYDVVYTIGEDGYRNDVQSTDFRAYIYGGSYTFGEGLNDNETLSFYLFQNHGISSKNVGVHGYGLNQALYNIEQGLVPQRENIVNVLLTAPWHALRSSCKPSYASGTPRYEIMAEGLQLVGVCSGGVIDRILQRSNIMSLITSVFQEENVITDYDIALYVEIIKEIARLSGDNNSELLITYIDATSEQLANTRWSNETIISELSKLGTIVDVTLAETREELDARFYIHELDTHPSAISNEYRASIISSYLQN